jgi:hypothetical protein
MEPQIETPKPAFVFEIVLENHKWHNIVIPKCLARCAKVDIFENTATTYTEYFSVLDDGSLLALPPFNDTFPIDIDQPLRAQVLGYFQSIFNAQPAQTEQPKTSLFGGI